MRYTVTEQIIQVIGSLWMGGTAAMSYTLSAYDMENLGNPRHRQNVVMWLTKNSGDFQSVDDFRADFTIGDESIVHEWHSEESELTYNDCTFGTDD